MRLRGGISRFSTRILVMFDLLIAMVGIPYSHRLNAQQSYTNADVIKMVQAHLGASVIVEQIRSNPGHYLLTPDSLVRLAKAGVPDEVIAAMQEKQSTQPSLNNGATEARGGEPASRSTTASWKAENKIDPMSGETQWQASLTIPLSGSNGKVEVTATCPDALWFRLRYIPGSGEDVRIVQSQPPPTMTTTQGTIDTPFGPMYSPRTTTSTMHYGPKTTTIEFNVDGIHGSMESTSQESNVAVIRFGDVSDSKTIRLQLPLTNGDKPVVEIHPQDKLFRAFTAKCFVPEQDEGSTGIRNDPSLGLVPRNTATNEPTEAQSQLAKEQEKRMREEHAAHEKAELDQKIAVELASAQYACASGDYASATASYDRVLSMDKTNSAALSQLPKAQAGEVLRQKSMAAQTSAGEWVDMSTGLMWTLEDKHDKNGSGFRWAKANEYCVGLRIGGYSDWRLPTVDELKSIGDPRLHIKGEIVIHDWTVWSGHEYKEGGLGEIADYYDFFKNQVDHTYTKNTMATICVRSYPPPLEGIVSCSEAAPQTAAK